MKSRRETFKECLRKYAIEHYKLKKDVQLDIDIKDNGSFTISLMKEISVEKLGKIEKKNYELEELGSFRWADAKSKT